MAKTQENTATQQSASTSSLVTAWCVRAFRNLPFYLKAFGEFIVSFFFTITLFSKKYSLIKYITKLNKKEKERKNVLFNHSR